MQRSFALFTAVLLLVLVHAISGCQKEAISKQQQAEDGFLASQNRSSEGAQTRPSLFAPTAAVFGCLGYNITFPSQPIILKENVTTNAKGSVHYIRHWSVAGLFAKATNPDGTDFLQDGAPVIFDVVSGQEMFSIKDPNTTIGGPSPATSGDVFIHQGTIVLENRLTKERVVIRHVIIKTPGQGSGKNAWYVQGQACS